MICVQLTVPPLGGSVDTQRKLPIGHNCSVLSVQHTGEGPMTPSATAARIVKNIQALVQGYVNSARVTEQLIMTISSQFSMLTGRPLSPEAQLYWQNQVLNMQLQNR